MSVNLSHGETARRLIAQVRARGAIRHWHVIVARGRDSSRPISWKCTACETSGAGAGERNGLEMCQVALAGFLPCLSG